MAELTVQTASRASAGTRMTAQSITGTSGTPDTFANNGYTLLLIYNANATAANVSVNFQRRIDGSSISAKTVSVTQDTANPVAFGPFDPNEYGSVCEVYTSQVSDTTAYVVSLI